ncbi:hypothetical protein NQ314_006810 [Rhamnusium bicolor]|uniref:Uncharacterized protein n=1 Tax=Rhamnusium bicolor TaxID=1586634 RepID=A0AAV8YWP6_9CUCU|nr:hypothetical protein NQ314_006810 [Rhamnusium bicolor]
MPLNLFTCDKTKSENIFSYFQTIFTPKYKDENEISKIYVGKHVYQKHVIIEEVDIVIRILQTEWYQLQNMVLYNHTIPFTIMISSRDLINSTFHALIESLQICDCSSQKERYIANTMKALNTYSSSVIPIIKLEDDILLKISTSSMKNVKCPIYQYFHSFLEIQYYLLAMDYILWST